MDRRELNSLFFWVWLRHHLFSPRWIFRKSSKSSPYRHTSNRWGRSQPCRTCITSSNCSSPVPSPIAISHHGPLSWARVPASVGSGIRLDLSTWTLVDYFILFCGFWCRSRGRTRRGVERSWSRPRGCMHERNLLPGQWTVVRIALGRWGQGRGQAPLAQTYHVGALAFRVGDRRGSSSVEPRAGSGDRPHLPQHGW